MTHHLGDVSVVVLCCTTCRTHATADTRHLDNLTAAGPWQCHACRDKETT